MDHVSSCKSGMARGCLMLYCIFYQVQRSRENLGVCRLETSDYVQMSRDNHGGGFGVGRPETNDQTSLSSWPMMLSKLRFVLRK